MKPNKIDFSFLKHKPYNWMWKIMVFEIFVIMFVFLFSITFVFVKDITAPNQPVVANETALLEYLGLPYIFWILVGAGIMVGLTLHGFKIVSIQR